jgi:acyl-CoA synthetase (AMP-forming)/AMP-acid ligase II
MRNYPEWLLAYWAIASVGAVSVGINAWWTASELKYGLEDSSPTLYICDEERLERFQEIRNQLPETRVLTVRTDQSPDWATPWADVLRADPLMPETDIDPEDDVCIFYTSGTTGKPKGAQLTHRGCANHVMSIAFAAMVQSRAIALAKGDSATAPSTPTRQSALITTPMFHVTANNAVAQGITIGGGKLVFMYKWDPGEALGIIEVEKVTTLSGVPTMSRELISHPDFTSRDTSSLAQLAGGGAPMQPDLVEKINKSKSNAKPGQGYGMTETCGIISTSAGYFLSEKPASAGFILPVFDVKCLDAEGNIVPRGETGEIYVRSAQVIKAYLNRPEATAETIIDGWLRTGDIGYIDEDNFLFLVDRAKDMVLRGGETVYCSEVEATIYEHSGVAECAVFSVADERLGEEVGAAVFPKPGEKLSAEDMRNACRGKLAPFKVPRYVWILDEPLPRNASGKFVKRDLKTRLDPTEGDSIA